MQNIYKKIILQKKYPIYKHLFALNIDDITDIKEFIKTIILIHSFKENKVTEMVHKVEKNIKLFDKDSLYIYLSYNYDKHKYTVIKNIFHKYSIPYQILYKLSFTNINIQRKEIKQLDNNYIIYIDSFYKKSDLFILTKNKNLFQRKHIILGLDNITKQDQIDHSIFFDMLKIFREINANVNYDLIRLESAYRKLYIIAPKEVNLDLHENCNTSCVFCATNGPGFLKRDTKENLHKQLYPFEYYKSLFHKLYNAGTESITLGITGEPFLYPQIKNIIMELKNIPFYVGFLTNGYRLRNYIGEIIENLNIKHFYINISAGNIKSFQATRPGDNFQNFINLWKACSIIRRKRKDIDIRGLYVITSLNISGIFDFVKLAIKNNLTEIELKRVVLYNFSEDNLQFRQKDIQDVIKILKQSYSFFKKKNTGIRNNFKYIIKDFQKLDLSLQYPGTDKNIDKSKLVGMTMNCYNPYFYISFFRSGAYTCCNFCGKIGQLTQLDLVNLLFHTDRNKNIIESAKNVKEFLGEKNWKEKCSRCHHMDINNLVTEYVKLKNEYC